MELKTVKIEKPEDSNIIIGQAHFIKTVEDLAETMVSSVPGVKFGVAFCESSGPCLVRAEGNDPALKKLAAKKWKGQRQPVAKCQRNCRAPLPSGVVV